MKLIAPFCRCRIGESVFESGDRFLLEVSVELGESEKSSRCSFSIYDSGLVIGGKFQQISLANGGIVVPPELLGSNKQQTATPTTATSTTSDLALPTSTGGAAILTRPTGRAKAAQSDYYNRVWSTMSIRPDRAGIVKEAAQQAIANQSRYQSISAKTGVPWHVVAAIHYRECSYNFSQNIANGDPLTRRTTNVPAGRIPGVAPPYTFEQAAIDALTSDNRFKGVNWGNIPDLCWFLESYNGLGYLSKGRPSPYLLASSQHYDSGLYVADGRYSASTVDRRSGTLPIIWSILNSKRTMAPETQPQPPQAQMQAVTPPVETSIKGTEIIIELGFEPDQLVAYHFIHVGTDSTKGEKDVTTFTGQSIRWLMTRRTENKSFENITLRQLAEIVTRQHNLKLEMEGNGPTYQFLDQTGITAYELLLRQCRSIGYTLKEDKNKLILKPSGRPEYTGIVIDWGDVLDLRFSDKARSDRASTSGSSATSPPTPQAQSKTVIDRQSGKVEQQKAEDKAGTGKAPSGVTGAAAPPVAGNVKSKPSTTTADNTPTESPKKTEPTQTATKTQKNPNGTTTIITTKTDKTIERGKITTIVETTSVTGGTTIKKVVTTTETTTGTTIDTEDIAANGVITKSTTSNNKVSKAALASLTLKADAPPPQPVTANPGKSTDDAGMPRQAIGAIDLADGRAEGEAIADEAKRIKGYESEATVVTTPEYLLVVPGQIIGISGELVPEPFNREWRVSSVSHKFPGGLTQLQFYTPQAAPATNAAPVASTAGTTATTPVAAPGKFIFPVPKGASSIGDGYGKRAGRPASYRHKILDVAAPLGTSVVAMADGVVTRVALRNGDAGNMVTIQYGGGYESTYMHLMDGGILVQQEQQVKQGQTVAKIGSTGRSSGNHLHLRFLLNSNVCLLSQIGIDVLKLGLPVQRFNPDCNKY
ncbi:peptidoglycan DD-metalloendopeptidase family protein [Nostoc sp. CENA67]|uniref:Peptidoglycan DD-metalloendopeptidase family protein n=1 Tax=Amazonocrinis nigriterrae CENA67 TaxID=2794033 RepID=A0A8J7I250_9NOST|nr:peptidoglycan DD-metalloendopeptidase family protein [Amazonocrinis nigriterrae]MBH8566709.1 peptidoglycan DD-metalloendopeptidase family protein [Amazonocrinis nigriterrae CENA67]